MVRILVVTALFGAVGVGMARGESAPRLSPTSRPFTDSTLAVSETSGGIVQMMVSAIPVPTTVLAGSAMLLWLAVRRTARR